jgi:hypothetical protein
MIGPGWLRWPWSAGWPLTAPSAHCVERLDRWVPAVHDGGSRPSSIATVDLVQASEALAGEATEALAELQPAPQPTPAAGQAAMR